LNFTHCPDCGADLEEAARRDRERLEQERKEADLLQKLTEREGRHFNYIEALFFSFFSARFYRDVFRRWKGSGVLYLAFVIPFGLIPYFLGLQRQADGYVARIVEPSVRQMPRLTFSNGQMSYDGPSPLAIHNPEDNSVLAVFDTTKTNADLKDIPGYIIMTSRQLAIRESNGQARIVNFSPDAHAVLTSEIVMHWVNQGTRLFTYFLYPFFWLGSWVFFLVIFLFYAMLTKLVCRLFKVPATFQDAYRLTAIAFTPVLLVDGLLSIWWPDGLADSISYFGPMFFILFAVLCNRIPKNMEAA
jgi:hypothetical protein